MLRDDSHEAHLAAHKAFWKNRKPTLHDGLVKDVVVPYVEWHGLSRSLRLTPSSASFRWRLDKSWIPTSRPWFSWGPICCLLAYSLSACAHTASSVTIEQVVQDLVQWVPWEMFVW